MLQVSILINKYGSGMKEMGKQLKTKLNVNRRSLIVRFSLGFQRMPQKPHTPEMPPATKLPLQRQILQTSHRLKESTKRNPSPTKAATTTEPKLHPPSTPE